VKFNYEKISKEFLEKYNKLLKTHKIKKNKDSFNPTMAVKNLELVITNIKQFSNNYFKIGYFKTIHTICFDFLRLLDTYSLTSLLNTILNNVVFYINNNSVIEKKAALISNKQLVFNVTGLLGLGLNNFNNSGTNSNPPFLPNASPEVFTLVLDLDETLVHFFFVFILLNLDSIWWYFSNKTSSH